MKIYELIKVADEELKKKKYNLALFPNEAKLLLSHYLDISYEKLFVRLREEVSTKEETEFMKMISIRCSGVPFQYIIGKENFYERAFKVKRGVFIPRPDTEALITAAKNILKGRKSLVGIECGTGSGMIPITLSLEIPGLSSIYTCDKSKRAVDLASINSKIHKTDRKVKIVHKDFFAYLKSTSMSFDLIISNPPYIKSADVNKLQKEVRFEPILALSDGGDGMLFYNKIAKVALSKLKKDGVVIVESGDGVQADIIEVFKNAGFSHTHSENDSRGHARALVFQP